MEQVLKDIHKRLTRAGVEVLEELSASLTQFMAARMAYWLVPRRYMLMVVDEKREKVEVKALASRHFLNLFQARVVEAESGAEHTLTVREIVGAETGHECGKPLSAYFYALEDKRTGLVRLLVAEPEPGRPSRAARERERRALMTARALFQGWYDWPPAVRDAINKATFL